MEKEKTPKKDLPDNFLRVIKAFITCFEDAEKDAEREEKTS